MVQGWQRRKDSDGARMMMVQQRLSMADINNGRPTTAINDSRRQWQSKVAARTAREFLFSAKTAVSKDLINYLLIFT
jgi:hypothetical protein